MSFLAPLPNAPNPDAGWKEDIFSPENALLGGGLDGVSEAPGDGEIGEGEAPNEPLPKGEFAKGVIPGVVGGCAVEAKEPLPKGESERPLEGVAGVSLGASFDGVEGTLAKFPLPKGESLRPPSDPEDEDGVTVSSVEGVLDGCPKDGVD